MDSKVQVKIAFWCMYMCMHAWHKMILVFLITLSIMDIVMLSCEEFNHLSIIPFNLPFI